MKSVSGYIGFVAGILVLLLSEAFFSMVIFSLFKNVMHIAVNASALWVGSCVLTGCIYVTIIGFAVIGIRNDGKNG